MNETVSEFHLRVNLIFFAFLYTKNVARTYSTVNKKSSSYALSVVINQFKLLICSQFQIWFAH